MSILERERVLIVDDDEVISGAVFPHLVSAGVDADLALEARSAERLLAANDYALIVMDAYLTGHINASAIAFFDLVRQLRPESHILLLSAYAPRLFTELAAMSW